MVKKLACAALHSTKNVHDKKKKKKKGNAHMEKHDNGEAENTTRWTNKLTNRHPA